MHEVISCHLSYEVDYMEENTSTILLRNEIRFFGKASLALRFVGAIGVAYEIGVPGWLVLDDLSQHSMVI